MSTNIECTACGDLIALEGDSVSLPFVCGSCEKKQEDLAVEAETAQLAADAEASVTELVDKTDIALEAAQQTIGTLMEAVRLQAHELDEAHQAEERSHKTVAKLMRTLTTVAAERDQNANMAVHNMLEGIRAVTDLQEVRAALDAAVVMLDNAKVNYDDAVAAGKALETERDHFLERYQTMKRNCIRLTRINNEYADDITALRKRVKAQSDLLDSKNSILWSAETAFEKYATLYRQAIERNAALVKEMNTPWYTKLGRWWKEAASLPEPNENETYGPSLT